jgi:hypothetical protein
LIDGRSGQAIRAAASGRVVYAGSVPTGTTRRCWSKKVIRSRKARK